jgi:hypothetical protein
VIVELNELEQALARDLATRRHSTSRAEGLKDARRGPMSAEEVDLEGAGAELAFCKLANVYPDTGGQPRPEDCHLADGRKVDVKATKHENGHLIAVRWKKPGAVDIYALVVGKFPKYRCAGFLPSSELLRDERLKSFGREPAYAAEQDELQRIEELLGD